MLNGVRQFVGDKVSAGAGVRGELATGERNVLAIGEGLGVNRLGGGMGIVVGVEADLAEIAPESGFKVVSFAVGQGPAAAVDGLHVRVNAFRGLLGVAGGLPIGMGWADRLHGFTVDSFLFLFALRAQALEGLAVEEALDEGITVLRSIGEGHGFVGT